MKWFKKILLRLVEWFRPSYKAKYTKELPETLAKRTVYVIGGKNHPWALAFECPCGCKKTVQLNVLKEAKPKWKFQILAKNKIDISPSILRTSECKSHFFIRKGRIYWCY